MFTTFVDSLCPQLFTSFAQNFCSKLLFTTFVFCSKTFVHNFCSQLLFTTFVHNFCSQLLFTTLVQNSCSKRYDKVSDTFTLKKIPDRFVTDSKNLGVYFFDPNFFWSKFVLAISLPKLLASMTNLRNVLQYEFAQFCFNLSWNYQECFAIRFCLKFFESVVNPSAMFSIQFYPKFLNLLGIFCNTILPTFF